MILYDFAQTMNSDLTRRLNEAILQSMDHLSHIIERYRLIVPPQQPFCEVKEAGNAHVKSQLTVRHKLYVSDQLISMSQTM